MRDMAILDRQLHTLSVGEIQEIRRISDTVFEPLMRPFRQKRTVSEFSFKESIRTAQRIGAFMPSYEKVKREHRKSRLVIAMSLAGIDRCSAVSLIPLFSCLKETALDFNFYVYTDDLIKAEFTHDGFLSNDWQIAWNHVAGPNVIQRLAELDTSSQEDMLLIIDSLGGGDSKWYEYWTWEERESVRQEQLKYMSKAGKYGFYSRIRQELEGDYSKIKNIKKIPTEWANRVRVNTKERWMETPALEDYMVRWAFNPEFGSVRHGDFCVPYSSAYSLLPKLKDKFRQIHLLTPNGRDHCGHLTALLKQNVIDYHHRANTIYGFATVLASIVHQQCPFDGPFTRKVSYEIIKISDYKGEQEDGDLEKVEESSHSILTKTKEECFSKLAVYEPHLPKDLTVRLEKKVKGANSLQDYELPFSELDVTDLLPQDMQLHTAFWKNRFLPYDFEIGRGDSEYTRLRKVDEVLETIRNYHIVFKPGGSYHGLVKEKKPVASYPELQKILTGIDYDVQHTSSLQEDLEEYLLMLSPVYHPYLSYLALKHVIWCGDGTFSSQNRAISINVKKSLSDRRFELWHELGHYLEDSCPPVGSFSNQIIVQKCGTFDRRKLVQVNKGEYSLPVQEGQIPWIKMYAGKWYKRNHATLPNPTEIISVYGEYFASKERLAALIKHDPNMVRFMAFVFMGGPVAAVKALQDLKKRKALDQMRQKARRSSGYSFGRGGSRGGWGLGRKKKDKGYGL